MRLRNKILIIIALIIVLAVSAFIYLSYIADYTFEDDRISLTVPAQTSFSVSAGNNEYFTIIKYYSNDENNITIDLIKPQNDSMTIYGVKLDVYKIAKKIFSKDLMDNNSYEVVKDTENLTIYHNKEKNRYTAFVYDEDKKVIAMVCCDNSQELVEKLAKSLVIKSFTTSGLNVANLDNNSAQTDT